MAESAGGRTRARILIADSAELVRRGIRDVLTRERQFSIVGEIARPQEVPQACVDQTPDIVFLGLGGQYSEGGCDGLAALRQTLRLEPFARVIVLLAGDAAEDLLEAVRAGARGALLRDAPGRTFVEAVNDVLGGGAALDPRLARSLFDYLITNAALSRVGVPEATIDLPAFGVLSRREQEVLRALAHGCRNKEIAAELGVSVGTVKTHLRHIFRKLNVADRTAAVLVALQVRLPQAA